MKQVTTQDKINAIKREIVMRKKVYPGRVAARKMTQDEADREILIMELIQADYESKPLPLLPAEEPQTRIKP